MPGPQLLQVDPRELHLPPSRAQGADPAKLQCQISRFGKFMAGMPPISVSLGTDGGYIIANGVTRATRVAKLLPGQLVAIEVIARVSVPASRFPTIQERLP